MRFLRFWSVSLGLSVMLMLDGALAGAALGARPLIARIGVAVAGHGPACLAISNPGLRAGARLVLVSPTPPRRLGRGVIIARGPDCPGWHGAGVFAYRLRLVPPRPPPGLVMFALPGTAQIRLDPAGAIGRLTPRGPVLRLRACTSAEGVHLTVWRAGAWPPRRVLHIYYYLDQDLAADCDEPQTAPPTTASR